MDDSETTIIAVAVVEHDRQYLIGKRPPGVPLAGYCEFPGGKVHPGETPAAPAERECLEETGLQVEVVRQLDAAVHDYDHGQLQLYFFLCGPLTYNLLKGAEPQAPFRWMDAEGMRSCEFPPANQRVLSILQGIAKEPSA